MDIALAQESVGLRILALAAALVPIGAFWTLVLARRSLVPLREAIGVSFALGVVIAFPVSLIGWGVEVIIVRQVATEAAAPLIAFLAAAVPEESAKFLALLYIALHHEDVTKPSDAIWLAVAVGLGFAALENVYYVVDNAQWHIVAGTRAVTAVPSHGFAGLIMGYLIALGLIWKERRRSLFALALILPVAEHGLYDTILMLAAFAPEPSQYRSFVNAAFVALLVAELLISVILLARAARSTTMHRAFAVHPRGAG